MNKLKIKYICWYSGMNETFFQKFIENYMGIKTEIVKDNPDIIFFSLYKNHGTAETYCRNTPSVKLKIFYTPEDTLNTHGRGSGYDHHYLNFADLSMGFKYIEHKNYIRFPLWLTYINIQPYSMGLNCLNINFNNIPYIDNKGFCTIVSNHDSNNTRATICHLLSKYKTIEIAGDIFKYGKYPDIKMKRNSISGGQHNKVKFIKNYKFNVCSESSLTKGYISEKLFECIISGCIPIYMADNNTIIEDNIINNDFIIKYTNDTAENAVKKIIEIDTNDEKYKEHLKINPFKPNANDEIIKYYDLLKSRLLKLFESKNLYSV